MGSLTGCVKKAGAALQAEDREAILAAFNEATAGGAKPAEAAAQAIDAQIAKVRQMLVDAGDVASVAKEEAEQEAAPEPVAAEPATVKESLQVAPMPGIPSLSMSLAQGAHRGTSFSPERRGEQEVSSYRGALRAAWERAAKVAGNDEAAIARITEVFEDVAAGYNARYAASPGAKSQIMSTMIAGGSNFPVRRMEKRNATARKRAEEAEQYLERGIKRLLRAARGPIDNSPESELERVRLNLSQREEQQELMKAANAALRKDDDAALEDLGFTAEQIADLKKGSKWDRGFPSYKLTNNNAEIRRLRERLQSAEERMAAAQAGPVEAERPGVKIVEDATADRLRLVFDEKPGPEAREALKSNGFRWSPTNNAWQRQLTGNARYAAEQVLDKHYPKAGEPDAQFSRRNQNQGVPMPDAKALVSAIREALPTAPPIQIHDSVKKAPEGLRRAIRAASADSDVEAAYHDGEIHVFPGNIASIERMQFVVAHHEVRHHGLRSMMGPSLGPAMLRMYATNPKLAAAADKKVADGLAKTRILAVEEALADMTIEEMQATTGWERIVSAVRQWLRQAAANLRRAGLTMAADAIDPKSWTDADIASLVQKAEDVSRGQAAPFRTGGTVFGRDRVAVTDTPAFKAWFKDSKVVDEDGKPLVVYHGTGRLDGNTKDGAIGRFIDSRPVWFTPDVGLASMYAKLGGPDQSVYPAHLAIKKPLRLPFDMNGPSAPAVAAARRLGADASDLAGFEQAFKVVRSPAFVAAAKARGHDGIQVTEDGAATFAVFDSSQIKSTIGNAGTFDPANPDIRFSRAPAEAIRAVIPDHVQTWLTDRTTSQRGFNRIWHRTVGTQLHKAKINKDFGRVFYAVQDFMKDVSRVATRAADVAPDMLPQIDTLTDLAKLAPTLASPKAYKQRKAEIKAASDALFDGTLRYTRDEDGKAVLVDPDSGELGGLVWTDAELKARGMSDKAVAMYRQSRQAIETSLDNLLASDVYRTAAFMEPSLLAGNPAEHTALLDKMRKEAAGENPGRAIDLMTGAIRVQLDKLTKAIEAAPNDQKQALENRRDTLREMQKSIGAKVNRIADLKAAGYAPLMRFGDYAVNATDSEGKRVFFGLYESQAEANNAARKFREQGLQVDQSVMAKSDQEALQGLSPETAMLFAEMMGVDKNEAMQTWLKNAVAEQSALKRHIRRKGIEGFDDDASRTLAAFITSNARATSRALHSQRIEESVENVKQGDVRDEAREMVKYINNPREEAQAIRSLLFMQYLGGSVASALVNMTQTFVQTFPYLAQYGGAGKAGKRVLSAMKQAASKTVADPELMKALKRAEDDGVIKPQEVFQLQAEASRGLGSNLYVRSIVAAWGSMFQLAEQYNRRVAFIAAYQTAKEEGNADPFAFAENAVDETQSVFNKGNRPNWARGAVGATLFTFKTFVIQYLEFLKRLPPKERMLALGVLVMLSGVRGLPFAEDAEDIVDTVAQAMGYNWSTKAEMNAWLDNALGQGASELVQQGFSALTPFDVSQRLGMANLLPGTGVLKKSEANKQNEVFEVFGVAGSAVNDALKGEIRPLAIRNLAKGINMAMTGEYEDTKGRKVTDVTALDALLKGIGLQPSTVAQESREVSRQYELNALHRAVKAEITEQWAQAAAEGDSEGVKKARDALAKWNATNPEAPIRIRPQTIIGRVREMKKSRAERFIKATPKERRQDVQEALA
jgi:hypothetical protein